MSIDLSKLAHFESRVGNLNTDQEMIYKFLSDFSNFEKMVPADKVKDFSCTEDTCRFTIDKVGPIGFRIMEKEAPKMIKVTADGKTPFEFFLWIQLMSTGAGQSKIRLTIKAKLNAMMKMMVAKPLKKGLDKIIDQLEMSFGQAK